MAQELTATELVNQKMLQHFKEHVEAGNVKVYEQPKEEDNGEWDDTGGSRGPSLDIQWLTVSGYDLNNMEEPKAEQTIHADPESEKNGTDNATQ